MASRVGRPLATGAIVLALTCVPPLAAEDSPLGNVLLQADFEHDAISAEPKGWLLFPGPGL